MHLAYPSFAIEREEAQEMKRRWQRKCVRRGREKSTPRYFLGGGAGGWGGTRVSEGILYQEKVYIRYTQRDALEFLLIHLAIAKWSAVATPRRRRRAVSLGTSRFTANLFRGVNHATLIFTQLCSPAQGAAAVPTFVPTCPRNRPEARSPALLSHIPPLFGLQTFTTTSAVSAGERASSLRNIKIFESSGN